MTGLEKEVEQMTRAWVRKGGKDNRRQQRARMLAFANHCAALGAHQMAQVGARHVRDYWDSITNLAPATRYNHWRAVAVLWKLSGKPGEPPRPQVPEEW